MPRSLVRVLAAASALAVAAIALTGCTQAPTKASVDDCGDLISKVLLTDDSATKVAKFSAGAVPELFGIPATPAPTCYYESTETLPPSGGVVDEDTHRTLLYTGLSDSEVAALIASLRKTVSVKPWTVRFDFGTPAPTAGATATPTAQPSTSSSARWYYNFAGAAADDKGEMGYYASTPMTAGTAVQAGLGKPVNLLRIELELKQAQK